jgi:tripartite-type tricarboxylate transporter receptor subunit TctC
MRMLLRVLLLALAGTSVALAAEVYPSKTTRMIVGATAGGGSDIVARLIASRLSARLGQPFIVENRPGAGGNIANDVVAKSKPDGYTLGMGYAGIAINPVITKQMPFDTLNDLAPVSLVALVHFFLVINPQGPITSMRGLIDEAKANPGKLDLGINARASVGHLSTELFKLRAGVDMHTVTYKGSSHALVDLLGGRIAGMIDTVVATASLVKSGKLRAVAFGGEKRSSAFPDVPTFEEAGLADFKVLSWFGVVAPAKTPPEILNRLSREIAEILREPEVKERFDAMLLEPAGSSPSEFSAFIRSEMQRWDGVVKAAGITIE